MMMPAFSRATFAQPLLDAVAEGRIPRVDITPYHARQIRSLNDAALNKKLAEVWGELRDLSSDKQKLIARWKAQLTPAALAKAHSRFRSRIRLHFDSSEALRAAWAESSRNGLVVVTGSLYLVGELLPFVRRGAQSIRG